MATADETSALHFGPASNGIFLSPWEFDRAQFENGCRYELVNGVLIVIPSPSRNDRDPNEELAVLLRRFQEEHPEGGVLDCTLPEETIHIGPHRRRADRVIWCGLGRLPLPNETPTIVVEFFSAGRASRQRDYEIKQAEYQSIGELEYWILDRFEMRMTVYRFDNGKIVEKTCAGRQTYATPLLPGFRVPVGRLLKLAARWPDETA